MSVSKSRATNSLLKSEKKSLFRFLALYLSMVLILMFLLGLFYYESQKKLFLTQQRGIMSQYAYLQTRELKVLHHFFDERQDYPRSEKFKSAIYDLEYVKIFSLLEENSTTPHFEEGIYTVNNHIHLVTLLTDFYLGAKFLIIEVKDDGKWRVEVLKSSLIYGFLLFLLFSIFGYYLAKLFLKPMRNSILLLDNFIKDTTHELNTPLATILANIEMMNKDIMEKGNRKKLERINISAKSVSLLYRDLTYLTLEQDKANQDETINLKELLNERAEYFDILMDAKKLTFILDLEDATIIMDRRKLTRIIDNLISNAIKYNKKGGKVGISLKKGAFSVWDNGIGMKEEEREVMFERYKRFNKSEGGFGVGLNIVKNIIDEYNLDIKVSSKQNEGTSVVIKW